MIILSQEERESLVKWIEFHLKGFENGQNPHILANYIKSLILRDASQQCMVSMLRDFMGDTAEDFITLLGKHLKSRDFEVPTGIGASSPFRPPVASSSTQSDANKTADHLSSESKPTVKIEEVQLDNFPKRLTESSRRSQGFKSKPAASTISITISDSPKYPSASRHDHLTETNSSSSSSSKGEHKSSKGDRKSSSSSASSSLRSEHSSRIKSHHSGHSSSESKSSKDENRSPSQSERSSRSKSSISKKEKDHHHSDGKSSKSSKSERETRDDSSNKSKKSNQRSKSSSKIISKKSVERSGSASSKRKQSTKDSSSSSSSSDYYSDSYYSDSYYSDSYYSSDDYDDDNHSRSRKQSKGYQKNSSKISNNKTNNNSSRRNENRSLSTRREQPSRQQQQRWDRNNDVNKQTWGNRNLPSNNDKNKSYKNIYLKYRAPSEGQQTETKSSQYPKVERNNNSNNLTIEKSNKNINKNVNKNVNNNNSNNNTKNTSNNIKNTSNNKGNTNNNKNNNKNKEDVIIIDLEIEKEENAKERSKRLREKANRLRGNQPSAEDKETIETKPDEGEENVPKYIIVVCGISPAICAISQILKEFNRFGLIHAIQVVPERKLALIEYDDLESAYRAVNSRHKFFHNAMIKADYAVEIDPALIKAVDEAQKKRKELADIRKKERLAKRQQRIALKKMGRLSTITSIVESKLASSSTNANTITTNTNTTGTNVNVNDNNEIKANEKTAKVERKKGIDEEVLEDEEEVLKDLINCINEYESLDDGERKDTLKKEIEELSSMIDYIAEAV